MAANTISTAGQLDMPAEVVTSMFNAVKGHSTIAKLSDSMPVPFSGAQTFVFTMDGEAALVGEGAAKPAGDALSTPKVITPVKIVYQHRLTDEFTNCAEEKRVEYLKMFADGFSKKIARALDIMAFHGVNPATGSEASFHDTNSFDGIFEGEEIEIDIDDIDAEIDTAIGTIRNGDREVTGIAFAPAAGTAMANVKVNGVAQYPEFRFGGKPETFYGYDVDINTTVTFGESPDLAIVGDFKNAFKWGYADGITFEVIEFGDPDGAGKDLKQYNQVCLRSEAYIGWGILDESSFALLTEETVTPDPGAGEGGGSGENLGG